MPAEFKRPFLALVAIGVLAVAVLAIRPLMGQSREAYTAPRTADGKPDLNGIWQAVNTANWDIEEHGPQPSPHADLLGLYLAEPAGLGVVEGGSIPYKPEALVMKNENFRRRLEVDPFNRGLGDPEAKCFLPGVPRATYMPYPFQIVQGASAVVIAYEYRGGVREIPLGNAKLFKDVDSWMGQSVGHWEGDILVVEVTGFNGMEWLDRAGNFLSDKAHVVERYTRVSPDHLFYEAVIDDPTLFTRSWKLSMPLYRRIDRRAQIVEFRCMDLVEEYLYGKLRKPS